MLVTTVESLGLVDYVVVGVFLAISLGIGIYYGFTGRKQNTPEEYLVGNRQLKMIPVALSLFVTFQSAVSLIGVPGEIYTYGSMFAIMYIGLPFSYLIGVVTIIPLLYPLGITSAYEYLERRFNSRAVRIFGTLVAMLTTIIYMGIVLLSPALAIEAVAGVPLWMSLLVVGVVGTTYTALGGIKSVVWTDVFQCVILLIGMVIVLIKGSMDIGGFGRVMDLSIRGKRIRFDDFNMDPRTRHTVWSQIIGGIFMWLPGVCSQSSIQRAISLKNVKSAKRSLLLSIPFNILYGIMLLLLGLLLYAHYHETACDPIKANLVGNSNQIMPFYVMQVLGFVPGLPGLYVATLLSGALSTLSSGINSLAANMVEDILKNVLKTPTRQRITIFAKVSVMLFGIVAIGVAYIAAAVKGPISQISLSAFGACGGPVVGLFFLGAMFPRANWIGALVGGFVSLIVNLWISLGAVLHRLKPVTLPSNPTSGCYVNITDNYNMTLGHQTTFSSYTTASYVTTDVTEIITTVTSDIQEKAMFVYEISYMWYGFIGFFLSVIIGIFVSLCTSSKVPTHDVDPNLIFFWCRRFWKLKESPTIQAVNFNAMKDLPSDPNTIDIRLGDVQSRK